MSTTQQPEALRLADILQANRCHLTAAELRRLHAENEALRAERERNLDSIRVNNEIFRKKNAEIHALVAGYAAARLEIESLRARSVVPAGEYPALPKFNAGAVATDASGKVEMYPAAFKQLLSEIYDRGAREAAGAWRAYVDADRAMRAAQPVPPDVSGYVSEWSGGLCTSDEAMDGIAKLYAAQPAGAQQPGAGTWTPLPGTLPEPGKPVLLDIGKKYPIRAMWVQKFTLPVGMEDDSGFGEYDEATDSYYCPEGWYEWNEHEECHWRVDKTPVAWCELTPKEQK